MVLIDKLLIIHSALAVTVEIVEMQWGITSAIYRLQESFIVHSQQTFYIHEINLANYDIFQ